MQVQVSCNMADFILVFFLFQISTMPLFGKPKTAQEVVRGLKDSLVALEQCSEKDEKRLQKVH